MEFPVYVFSVNHLANGKYNSVSPKMQSLSLHITCKTRGMEMIECIYYCGLYEYDREQSIIDSEPENCHSKLAKKLGINHIGIKVIRQ